MTLPPASCGGRSRALWSTNLCRTRFLTRFRLLPSSSFPSPWINLAGHSCADRLRSILRREDRGVGCMTSVESKLSWLDDFEHFVFQVLPDATHKAIRKATQEDIKAFRVPIWIQGEAVPICCDREMIFVGQRSLDNDRFVPSDQKVQRCGGTMLASFYVLHLSDMSISKPLSANNSNQALARRNSHIGRLAGHVGRCVVVFDDRAITHIGTKGQVNRFQR